MFLYSQEDEGENFSTSIKPEYFWVERRVDELIGALLKE